MESRVRAKLSLVYLLNGVYKIYHNQVQHDITTPRQFNEVDNMKKREEGGVMIQHSKTQIGLSNRAYTEIAKSSLSNSLSGMEWCESQQEVTLLRYP